MKLTAEERQLLEKLSKSQLIYLSGLAEDKDFPVLTDITNFFINVEKNKFFGENETTEEALTIKHAFARGNVAGLVKLLHIIGTAKGELDRRSKDDGSN